MYIVLMNLFMAVIAKSIAAWCHAKVYGPNGFYSKSYSSIFALTKMDQIMIVNIYQ